MALISDTSFLCLDINDDCVSGMAILIKNNHISDSAVHIVQTSDTVYGIKSVIDELERKLGLRFTSAYITGDFGFAKLESKTIKHSWGNQHKIGMDDVNKQLSRALKEINSEYRPLHIIPGFYNDTRSKFSSAPIGHIANDLVSNYKILCYLLNDLDNIATSVKQSHIQTRSFYDHAFLISRFHSEKNKNTLMIDMGAKYTTLSIWNSGCPVFFEKLEYGQDIVINEISKLFNISLSEARRIKNSGTNLFESELDRFTQADSLYGFSKSELNAVVIPFVYNLIERIQNSLSLFFEKNSVSNVLVYGSGSEIKDIDKLFYKLFNTDIKVLDNYKILEALQTYILATNKNLLKNSQNTGNFITKLFGMLNKPKKFKKNFWMPIYASTMAFDMNSSITYDMFRAGPVSAVHVDVMDGFFVNNICGGIEQIKTIKQKSGAHIHVHLMTENPVIWGNNAINAGADTVILSAEAAGSIDAVRELKKTGKKIGLALNPETPITAIKSVIKILDEVLILAVTPGSGGQEFNEFVLTKVRTLSNTRDKYKLNFKICVDGGINDKTSHQCWKAGADCLVSGSYLANSSDFALALRKLLPQK